MDQSFSLDLPLKRWSRCVELSNADRDSLLALPWVQRTFSRDAYVVREGQPTSTCALLVSGYAFRQKLVSTGARQIISIHIAGEFLDLQNGLFKVADHNVQSLGRSTVALVNKDALFDLVAQRRNIAQAVWLDTLLDSSVFREWVVNVGRRNARTRIAHLLCELADRLKASGQSDGGSYDFPLTQEQIADATGLTAVHTNRTLQSLRREGLINLSANRLEIPDWERLADLADFNERYLHYSV